MSGVWKWLSGAGVALVVTVLVAASAVTALLSGTGEGACTSAGNTSEAPATGLAAPLLLTPGRWYQVGASEYGGPGDPSSGSYGAIPDPRQSYLPAHPDSFAELSLLTANPANSGRFTFADANALGRLPYLTALRVTHDGHSLVLAKRDIGYGQGPGQTISNGQPYRLDLWWQAAQTLRVSKSPVQIELAPASGAAATLQAPPSSNEAPPRETETGACVSELRTEAPLALLPGASARILPSGLAAAGSEDPAAVRAMVAAGNRLAGAEYLYGGAHGVSLNSLQPAYDCSSAVSYLLHAAGLLGTIALDSTGLSSYGLPGPGRYVSIYANAAHTFIYVAGLRLDTVEDPAYDRGPSSGRPGPKWRLSPTVPDWSTWTVRHPPGL